MEGKIKKETIGPLISFMEKSKTPWGIKDRESRFIYMNSAALHFGNLPKNFNPEGLFDSDFPAEWSELSTQFIEHDRLAEKTGDHIEIIQTHYFYGSKTLEPYLCEKFPIYNEIGECIGTANFSKKLKTASRLDLINNVSPSVIFTTPPNNMFTQKELEIIFFSINRLTAKEIAKRFNISHRTIENRLQVIYNKAGVNSVNGLTEFCISCGLNQYVPPNLLHKEIKII
ncbi:Bacterial regulatory proteins, luxR family (plasmid) [Sodalis glossinidius str. 'morsitans']|nr:PAS domain-containing protein [Sodalis glossinidius]CRL46921.1 Bacterial regulatory proteins, luxR family [Sodalis glossinidius str. 'morsitans']